MVHGEADPSFLVSQFSLEPDRSAAGFPCDQRCACSAEAMDDVPLIADCFDV